MDQINALRETIDLAQQLDSLRQYHSPYGSYTKSAARVSHFKDMLERAIEHDYSAAKLGRHLGWVQGCVYSLSSAISIDLDTFKGINLHWAGDEATVLKHPLTGKDVTIERRTGRMVITSDNEVTAACKIIYGEKWSFIDAEVVRMALDAAKSAAP